MANKTTKTPLESSNPSPKYMEHLVT